MPPASYHARARFVSSARAVRRHSVAPQLSQGFGAAQAVAEAPAAAEQLWSVRPAAANRTRIALVQPLREAAANTWRTLHQRALRGKLRPNPSLKPTRHGMRPWPRSRVAHHRPRGQGRMPRRAA